LAGVGIIILAVALFFVYQRTEFIKTERHVKKLLIQKREITAEILPLKIEERYLSQLDKVEFYAKEHLKMVYPQKLQILRVKLQPAVPKD
ncbi:MAG: hypothetical protein GY786_08495, partial [Proteobacteria bacterium]|nr:hypothetical protein [Pseudomonadota bacterium]